MSIWTCHTVKVYWSLIFIQLMIICLYVLLCVKAPINMIVDVVLYVNVPIDMMGDVGFYVKPL